MRTLLISLLLVSAITIVITARTVQADDSKTVVSPGSRLGSKTIPDQNSPNFLIETIQSASQAKAFHANGKIEKKHPVSKRPVRKTITVVLTKKSPIPNPDKPEPK